MNQFCRNSGGDMKVTIFDLETDNRNEEFIKMIESDYKRADQDTKIVIYHSQETAIRDCIGCWSCWWKTPGKCAINDADSLYGDYINSDEVVLLFHTANGFLDGKGKTFIDRLIQHSLPYIKLRDGECGHLKRYDTYPLINFYFNKNDLSKEEITIIQSYCARTAYHFQSPCKELLFENEIIKKIDLEYKPAMKETLLGEVEDRNPQGRWVIYNGSPRGNQSNSKILIEKIIKGMTEQGIETVEVRNLIQTKEHKKWAEDFRETENNLFVFPLYVHAMPGSVMKFFETLQPIHSKDVHMAFFVQSGFPETSQSYYLRPYLEILTKRLGVSYDGIIIKGGMEGTRITPEKSNKKLFDLIEQIGRTYATTGIMDKSLKKEFEKEERMSKRAQFVYNIVSLTGLTNLYWDYNLRQNKAFKNRYARPYQE